MSIDIYKEFKRSILEQNTILNSNIFYDNKDLIIENLMKEDKETFDLLYLSMKDIMHQYYYRELENLYYGIILYANADKDTQNIRVITQIYHYAFYSLKYKYIELEPSKLEIIYAKAYNKAKAELDTHMINVLSCHYEDLPEELKIEKIIKEDKYYLLDLAKKYATSPLSIRVIENGEY